MSTLTTLTLVAGSGVYTGDTGTDVFNWSSANVAGNGSVVVTDGAGHISRRKGTLGIGTIPPGSVIAGVQIRVTHLSSLTGVPSSSGFLAAVNGVNYAWDGRAANYRPAGGGVSDTCTITDLNTSLIEDAIALDWGWRYATNLGVGTQSYTVSLFEVDITWDPGSYKLPEAPEPNLPPGTIVLVNNVPRLLKWPSDDFTVCGHHIVYNYPDSYITIDSVQRPLGPITIDCFQLPYSGPKGPGPKPGGPYEPTKPTPIWIPGVPTDYGWNWSFDGFTGKSHITIEGNPHKPRSFDEVSVFAAGGAAYMGGFPGGAVTYHNRMIYAASGAGPSIRVFDGQSDREMVKIPATSAGATPIAIMSMMVAAGRIFIATLDSGTNSTNFAGRVFRFDPITQKLEQMSTAFSAGEVPYALCWHMGRLWVGTNKSSGAGGKIYWFRPDIDAAWTTDYTLATSTAGGALSMCSFQGKLYVGCDAAAATFAKVLVRDTAGAYTTARTGTGGTARVNNGWPYLVLFNEKLYASYWNQDTTAIARIDQYDGTTWSTIFTGATTTLRPYLAMFVDQNILYVIGGGFGLVACLFKLDTANVQTDLTTFLNNDTTGIPMFGVVIL